MKKLKIKITRFINNQIKSLLWLMFFYLLFKEKLSREYGIYSISPFKWNKWHNDAKLFIGILHPYNKEIFIKTNNKYNCAKHEYEISKCFYKALPSSTAKPIKILNEAIIFERLKGETLDKIVNSSKGLSKLQWELVLNQFIEIIRVLHDIKMIHRDITPNNIIISNNTNNKKLKVYLIDFSYSMIKTENNNREYLNNKELFYLGLSYKPNTYKWDDAYSLYKIIKLIEKKTGYLFPYHSMIIKKNIEILTYKKTNEK